MYRETVHHTACSDVGARRSNTIYGRCCSMRPLQSPFLHMNHSGHKKDVSPLDRIREKLGYIRWLSWPSSLQCVLPQFGGSATCEYLGTTFHGENFHFPEKANRKHIATVLGVAKVQLTFPPERVWEWTFPSPYIQLMTFNHHSRHAPEGVWTGMFSRPRITFFAESSTRSSIFQTPFFP